MSEVLEKMQEFWDSKKGKDFTESYVKGLKHKALIKQKYINKIVSLIDGLSDNELDVLLEKFILWEDKFCAKTDKDYSCLFELLFEVWSERGITIKPDEESIFLRSRIGYRGWIIELYSGQGYFYSIFKN
jgi:hypothetical protein